MPERTWKTFLKDPYTSIAGVTAACSLLVSLPLDRASTWILALSACLGGMMAADRVNHSTRKEEEPKVGD